MFVTNEVPTYNVKWYIKENKSTKWVQQKYDDTSVAINLTFEKAGVYDICVKGKIKVGNKLVWVKKYFENITVRNNVVLYDNDAFDNAIIPIDLEQMNIDGSYLYNKPAVFYGADLNYEPDNDNIEILMSAIVGECQKTKKILQFTGGDVKSVELLYAKSGTAEWKSMWKDTNVERNKTVLDYSFPYTGDYDFKLKVTTRNHDVYVWNYSTTVELYTRKGYFANTSQLVGYQYDGAIFYATTKKQFDTGSPKWTTLKVDKDTNRVYYTFPTVEDYVIATKTSYLTEYTLYSVQSLTEAASKIGAEFDVNDYIYDGTTVQERKQNYDNAVVKLAELGKNGASIEELKQAKKDVETAIYNMNLNIMYLSAMFENKIPFDLCELLSPSKFKDEFMETKYPNISVVDVNRGVAENRGIVPYTYPNVYGDIVNFKMGGNYTNLELPLSVVKTIEKYGITCIEIKENGVWTKIGGRGTYTRYLENGVYDFRFTYKVTDTASQTLTVKNVPIYGYDLDSDYTTEKLGYTPYGAYYQPLNIITDTLHTGKGKVSRGTDIDGDDIFEDYLLNNYNNTKVSCEVYIQQVGTTKWIKICSGTAPFLNWLMTSRHQQVCIMYAQN